VSEQLLRAIGNAAMKNETVEMVRRRMELDTP
jgi:hypothetical protein